MKRIRVRDLRNEYGRVLKEVAAGEAFTLTSDGDPVATIAPYEPPAPTGPREGVPVADLLAALRPSLSEQQAADLKADLAAADWSAHDLLEGAAEDDEVEQPR